LAGTQAYVGATWTLPKYCDILGFPW
jgi:hypothetical protein